MGIGMQKLDEINSYIVSQVKDLIISKETAFELLKELNREEAAAVIDDIVSELASFYSQGEGEADIQEILKNISLLELVMKVKERAALESGSVYPQTKAVPSVQTKYYPLTSAQKRLYIVNEMADFGTSYNLTHAITQENGMDKGRLEGILKRLIKRHEALRTSISIIKGEPTQIVHQNVEFEVEYMESEESDVQNKIREFIRPFDLAEAPLFRTGLIQLSGSRQLLIFDFHHIISDGISINNLMKEMQVLFEDGKLQELKMQYGDYAIWQNKFMKSEKFAKQEKYWLEAFSGELPVLDFPTDYPRPAAQKFDGCCLNIKAGKDLTDQLKVLSKETNTTMFMLLLAAYTALLHKYTGQKDIIVGSAVAGREQADTENIVGLFVNTLLMRNYPQDSKPFKKFLQEVKNNSLKAFKNQDYQFEELLEKLDIPRDFSRNPLFDTAFIFQNHIKQNKSSLMNIENRTSKFDITLEAVELEGELDFEFEYSTNLFERETIQRLAGHLVNLLKAVTADPEVRLEEIEVLSEKEKQQLLIGFNSTETEYPKDKTIQELFEEQVVRNPDKTALVYEGSRLSYRELNEKANRLARYLIYEKGIKKGDAVALLTRRSLEMGVGIFAILKAGGVCVPIDTEYPTERINAILEDSGAKVLLKLEKSEFEHGTGLEDISTDSGCYDRLGAQNIKSGQVSGSPAYIIYTSGSTGKPKGVILNHYGIINHAYTKIRELRMCREESYCQNLNISFVASIWQVFAPLFLGAELFIYPEAVIMDSYGLFQRVERDKIHVLEAIPSLVNSYLNATEEGLERLKLKDLRLIALTGEKVQPALINSLNKHYKIELVNAYGQSECSDDTLHYRIPYSTETYRVPIGKPSNNTRVYVLDQNKRLQPIGVSGDLFISGDGLAERYLNRPEMTAEKFVENPFSPGTKMFKTGDLARWLPDGNVECLGRADHQVKIRGFRIEPGEIEAALQKQEYIKEAAVTPIDDGEGNKYLCAYIAGDENISVTVIREDLSKVLPDYMVPSCFVFMDRLPLNANGKIDRRKLPEPETNMKTGIEYEAPGNETEKKLLDIWKEVLGVNSIGIRNKFFEMGGHSLKAVILASRIHKEFNAAMPLMEVFRLNTVKLQAEYIKRAANVEYTSIPIAAAKEYYPASSAQKRMYVVNSLEKGTAYNISAAFVIEGALDKKRFEDAFQELINRHETLRTSFGMMGEEIVQNVHKAGIIIIEYRELEACAVADEALINQRLEAFIRPFDLSIAPLLRIGLIRIADSRHLFMVDMHHIISDGTSVNVLVSELARLYTGEKLPPLKLHYKDFAVWQIEKSESMAAKKQEAYWLGVLKGKLPVLDMPLDFPRPSMQSFEGAGIDFCIDRETVQGLIKLAAETDSTMFMVLLAAYNVLLHIYSGQEDIIVGTPAAGRTRTELHNMLGMFVNTLAIRNCPEAEKTFREFLTEVRENALGAFENQDYPFDGLAEKLNLKRDASRNPLFDVMLILQNFERRDVRFEGLEFKPCRHIKSTSMFDMTLTASDSGNGMSFNLEYCSKLYKKETMESFAGHFILVLQRLLQNSEIRLADIHILSEEDKERLFAGLDSANADTPRVKAIWELQEVQYEAPCNETEEKLVEIWQDILKIDRIGVLDNFFHLGGHSLKATVLAARLHKTFQTEIPLQELFEKPTIKQLAEHIAASGRNRFTEMKRIEKRETFELSSAQKRLFVLDMLEVNKSISYNMPIVLKVEGSLDYAGLNGTFVKLIDRHEAFRTSFAVVDGQPVQKIHDSVAFKIGISETGENSAEEVVLSYIRPFDLRKAPLIRVHAVKIKNKEEWLLLIDMHHIISDGTSIGILMRDFSKIYRGSELPYIRIQYKDYAVWQQNQLSGAAIKDRERYWLKAFEGEVPLLNMPLDYARPAVQSYEGDKIEFELDEGMTAELNNLAFQNNASLYMVLLAAYNSLLMRYTGQEDIVVGCPAAGRRHADLQNTIGMFVNTLALRNYPKGSETFKDFLSEVRENALLAYENQEVQFEDLVEKINIKRDLGRNPIFDTMFALQNAYQEENEMESLGISNYRIPHVTAKFDFSLDAVERENKLHFVLEYCTKLFKRETMLCFAERFKIVLKEIAKKPFLKLSEIEFMTEKEKRQLLYDFNDTRTVIPKDKTVCCLFEEQAERTPEHTAVVFGDKSITYRELNERVNHLAWILIKKGAGSDNIVGISAERSIELMIGIMGILKAGSAYLPIDPDYPQERVQFMLEDSGVKLLVVQAGLKNSYGFEQIKEIPDCAVRNGRNVINPPKVQLKDLAYVIYTSGSTGKPKGVLIEHGSMVNYANNFSEKFGLHEGDTVLNQASCCFDTFIEEVFPALISGAAVAIAKKEEILDIQRLCGFIKDKKVTVISVSPLLLNEIDKMPQEAFKNVRAFISGGDVLKKEHIKNLVHTGNVYNTYGPTETTVCAAYHKCGADDAAHSVIGKPISNYKVYILSPDYGTLQPVGIPGELCISGDGLARGYLNRPELTAEKFVQNPFIEGERMYHTGDLARWLPDGSLEFLGRIDQQVKIRGYRIEPGEIESRLKRHASVKEAVVAAKVDAEGDKYLCAYIVCDGRNVSRFREYLSRELPGYMLPSCFMKLDKVPHTTNGKVDVKALPAPDALQNAGIEYIEPGTRTEKALAKLWQKILKLENIGITENFFEIGGHSLKAAVLADEIRKCFLVEVPLLEIFKKPSIKQLGEYIDRIGEFETPLLDDKLVMLKKAKLDSGNYIFLIHDGSCTVEGYLELCDNMDVEASCVGIRPEALKSAGILELKLEVIANNYIEAMKKLQKYGPYSVIGWSTGGTIAFEIIRQLESRGEKVGITVLIDSVSPVNELSNENFELTKEAKKLIARDLQGEEDVNLLEIIEHSQSQTRMWEEILDYFENIKNGYQQLLSRLPEEFSMFAYGYKEPSVEELIKHYCLYRSVDLSRQSYVPAAKVKSRIHYYKAEESNEFDGLGWEAFSKKPLQYNILKGSHYSMLKSPYAKELASLISREYREFRQQKRKER